MAPPRFFISYRRVPDAPVAQNLATILRRNFGEGNVYLDTASVRIAGRWPDQLRDALKTCSMLIAVIGPDWLSAKLDNHKRRLDDKEDWVRKEIEAAIDAKIALLPLLVRDAKLPAATDLPPSLRSLPTYQHFEIRDEFWQHDAKSLVKILKSQFAAGVEESKIDYPKPDDLKPLPLTDEQIEQVVDALKWTVEETPITDHPDLVGKTRVELCRTFRFDSFRDAVDFMQRTAAGIDAMNHHPRWENVYQTLHVRVTTWDIKHRLSDRDATLARYLENEYQAYVKGAARR